MGRDNVRPLTYSESAYDQPVPALSAAGVLARAEAAFGFAVAEQLRARWVKIVECVDGRLDCLLAGVIRAEQVKRRPGDPLESVLDFACAYCEIGIPEDIRASITRGGPLPATATRAAWPAIVGVH